MNRRRVVVSIIIGVLMAGLLSPVIVGEFQRNTNLNNSVLLSYLYIYPQLSNTVAVSPLYFSYVDTLRSQFSDLNSQVSVLVRLVDEMYPNTVNLIAAVASINTSLAYINNAVNSLTVEVNSVQAAVSNITSWLNSLQNALNYIGEAVSMLQVNVTSIISRINSLEDRVAALEALSGMSGGCPLVDYLVVESEGRYFAFSKTGEIVANSTSLKTVLNAVNTKAVWLTSGTYFLDATVEFGSGTILQGVGKAVITSGSLTQIFRLKGDNIVLKDLTIDALNVSSYAVYVQGNGVTIQNVRFDNLDAVGIYIGASSWTRIAECTFNHLGTNTKQSVQAVYSNNIVIEGNVFQGVYPNINSRAVYIMNNVNNVTIRFNTFKAEGNGVGVGIYYASSTDFNIFGNSFHNLQTAVHIEYGTRIRISNNVMHSCSYGVNNVAGTFITAVGNAYTNVANPTVGLPSMDYYVVRNGAAYDVVDPYGNIYSVSDFAALLSSLSGRSIVLGSGEYVLNSRVTLGSYTSLRGQGIGTVIKSTVDMPDGMLMLSGDYIIVAELNIDASMCNSSNGVIYSSGSFNIIDGVRINGFGNVGITLTGTQHTVINCKLVSAATGTTQGIQIVLAHQVLVTQNFIQLNSGSTSSSAIYIMNNVYTPRITENYLRNLQLAGYGIQVTYSTSDRLIISNNRIENFANGIRTAPSGAYYTIEGNIFHYFTYGVYINTGGNQVVVTGNVFYSPSGTGVHLASNTKNNVVTGNTFNVPTAINDTNSYNLSYFNTLEWNAYGQITATLTTSQVYNTFGQRVMVRVSIGSTSTTIYYGTSGGEITYITATGQTYIITIRCGESIRLSQTTGVSWLWTYA